MELLTQRLLLIVMLCLPFLAHAQSNAYDELMQLYEEKHQFQGAVLVATEGRVLFENAYGYSDREQRKQNTLAHQFLIGSLTKSFTAVAIMRLVQERKVDLHAPLSLYLPDLDPQKAERLTLHLLLKHQSGLPNHLERLISFDKPEISSQEILAVINDAPLQFEPGSQYQYGNLNYHLAAMVIENVTNLSYVQAMAKLVFAPLNMANSGVERLHALPENRAKGYRKKLFGISHDENQMSYALGSGDIYSTVDDLLKWDQALYGEGFLTQQSKALLFSKESEAFGYYGYGFRVQPYQRAIGTEDFGILTRHGGSMDGFLANLHRYTDDKLTVIVLGNIRSFPIRNLTFELKEIALGIPVGQRQRKPVE
ncbi:MAG: serine hydrolase domain-containing protein [Aestuariibacter sp.]